MELEEPLAGSFGPVSDPDGMEVDPWDGLIQPDTALLETPAVGEHPVPRYQQLKELRVRLGWVADEMKRRKGEKKPTKRQVANLKKLQKVYSRYLGRARTNMRGLFSLREHLQTMIRVRSLQERKARKKESEKKLKDGMVSKRLGTS